jgi:hypothetical protein
VRKLPFLYYSEVVHCNLCIIAFVRRDPEAHCPLKRKGDKFYLLKGEILQNLWPCLMIDKGMGYRHCECDWEQDARSACGLVG